MRVQLTRDDVVVLRQALARYNGEFLATNGIDEEPEERLVRKLDTLLQGTEDKNGCPTCGAAPVFWGWEDDMLDPIEKEIR